MGWAGRDSGINNDIWMIDMTLHDISTARYDFSGISSASLTLPGIKPSLVPYSHKLARKEELHSLGHHRPSFARLKIPRILIA